MLELQSVHVSISGISILRDISFRAGQSETIALVGHNGAGKTTTLRTIMGFTQTRGSVTFEGRDLIKVAPHDRPGLGIGYAPEDRRLFSGFTVEENILLPARIAGLSPSETAKRRDRAYSVLPELKTLAPRPAGSVSGGQGKMVALGRALMSATRLLLLDEPFQGLAPVLANTYAAALRRLHELAPEISVIITESNPELLERFANRVITMERGAIASDRIVQQGAAQTPA
ncbi:amino acid/amide ABC transporter ATP-binding protein 2, HAAT family [Gemmobacter megaterium]|uniref:Amino acid/amide ABC transporter ATP-binding protein 2, HAAT family n=1 Tax=Gemmobacter megaterium TaxID=1086013 RepID=A0A1N7PBR1_9RHOB|nr:ATP-binding cassette domain-containing protein [Gemmobacter megaterium]GGE19227.1 ABC transporter ATP-binding protein [Gemmobacter megaterium]SIT08021.1 amino acid/amide ABC transporter ATP-binding protein 2, HAAT family [Gemmobacter megaterium]